MRVRCIANTGKSLLRKTIESGELKRAIYPIDLGREYNIYGISLWRGALYYLIDFTEWYPAELFEVVDHSLPDLWYFDFRKNWYFNFEKNEKCEIREAIWGYNELVFNFDHKNDLLQGDKEAIAIFRKRKKEIDEFQRTM